MKRVVNIADLEFKSSPVPIPEQLKETYEGATMARFSSDIGAEKLGYNVTKLPPGKRAFPRHAHHVNEELFFVLEGAGEVRIGEETFPIKKGDFICCPPGGAELAHQIINTSDAELSYIAVSTKLSPEIAEYPDSKKFGVMDDKMRFLGRAEDSLGYFDGE